MKFMCSRCTEKEGNRIEELSISQVFSDYLEGTRYSHLCSSCISVLNELVEKAKAQPFPKAGDEIDGIHYTIENGLLVFTEYYHVSRGYCCENDCRNCAYGYSLRT